MQQADTIHPRDLKIIDLSAQGLPCRKIAANKEVDVSFSTVNRITNKHKELIQTIHAQVVEHALPEIGDRIIREVKAAHKLTDAQLLDKDNQVALTRIDKKEESILKGVGIAPSHAPSIHVQQIFNDNRKTILSPNVASLLHGKMNDIIDGEIIEDEANEQD